VYKTGKWAHSLCCQWIPEIYVVLDKNAQNLNLVNLDKKRFKLRCGLCSNNKGACVQCSYGRCTTSVHPWCALKTPQGCTRRIVSNADGEVMWEIFCKAHATAVSEPIKPKPKAKQSVPIAIEEPSAPQKTVFTALTSTKKEKKESHRYSEGGISSYFNAHSYSNNKAVLSMSHAKNFNAARLLHLNNSATTTSKTPLYAEEEDEAEAEPDYDSEYEFSYKQKPTKKASKTINHSTTTTANAKAKPTGTNTSSKESFPILNMLEWPGISEGEPMDLDHFWNVVSGHYPEDHSTEVSRLCICLTIHVVRGWCRFTTSAVLKFCPNFTLTVLFDSSSQWLEYMIADLQKPIVPQSVQAVLDANAAAIPTSVGASTSAGGKTAAPGRARRTASDTSSTSNTTSGTTSGGVEGGSSEDMWVVPPLGQAKNANRAEVTLCFCCVAHLQKSELQFSETFAYAPI